MTDEEAVRVLRRGRQRFVLALSGRVLSRGECWHTMQRRWRQTEGATLWRVSPIGGGPLLLKGEDDA